MSERNGTKEARELFSSSDVSEWSIYLGQYENALSAVAKAKKKPELVSLDKFCSSLKIIALNRSPPHITSAELSDIMRWKLIRGKFRPLQKLVDSNPNASVIATSAKAFQSLLEGDWESCLNTIIALKAIGVATASAVFAPISPQLIPFMADEVIEAVTLGKRDYNMKVYKEMRSALISKAAALGGDWDAEKVGRALWTRAMLHAHNVPSNGSTTTKTNKKRNVSEESEEDQEDSDSAARSGAKKRKS